LGAVICFINQKGGCGKSSSCFHLAGYFSQVGMEVLVIDADPQGSLSQGFLGSEAVESLPAETTLAALFSETFVASPRSLIMRSPIPGVSIVGANQTLARHNVPAPEHAKMNQFALTEFLAEVNTFDVVLIDCPPNLYLCSWNAMLAANFVVIPVPPEDFGTQGLRAVHQAIDNARLLNPELTLLGHVVTRRDNRLLVHRTYEHKLRQLYTSQVFATVVPEASAFKVALACRTPVTIHSPGSKAAKLTRTLGCEIVRRMEDVNLETRKLSHG